MKVNSILRGPVIDTPPSTLRGDYARLKKCTGTFSSISLLSVGVGRGFPSSVFNVPDAGDTLHMRKGEAVRRLDMVSESN